MEKIVFETDVGEEEFTVIADTKLQGKNYILLTDSPENEEEGSFLVLRDNSSAGDEYASYEEIEDELILMKQTPFFKGDSELEKMKRIASVVSLPRWRHLFGRVG